MLSTRREDGATFPRRDYLRKGKWQKSYIRNMPDLT